MGFVDLHSHVLPGLDDGAPDEAASLQMLQGLAALGFETVCATPHQKAGQFLPTREAIDSAHVATCRAAADAGVGLRLPLAAENMWDAVFYERLEAGAIPSYDGGPAFLVEFPLTQLPVSLREHLFRLRMQGKLPVIAHPERYEPLWPEHGGEALLTALARECAMVVDLGAVAGYHGRRQAKAARAMLRQGIAHAAASDAHTPGDVRVAAEGIAWIRKRLGDEAVTRLLDRNPRRILAGEHPEG
jgi:protein-tyrosine phosphatase